MWIILLVFVILTAGCSGNLPGSSLLTPPASSTEMATQSLEPGNPTLPTETATSPVASAQTLSTATDEMIETATAEPTVLPTLEIPPTIGPTPTRTVWWRRTPTITPTPQPLPAVMFIKKPGQYSKVKSPLVISANASPGADGLVWVELIGEDGRNLFQTRLNFTKYAGLSISIAPEITFELQAPAELARLVISTRDSYGRISALTSTDIILIQMGDDQIYPAGYAREPYIVRSPLQGQVISGGMLQVSALARPVNDNPLILELIDEKGTVIGSTSLDLVFPTGNLSHTPFDVTLPYSVSQSTKARLVLRQESTGRIPGTVALSSLELTLQP